MKLVIRLDLERVRRNVQQATDEDLLDRATVFRAGMERAALEIIDAELIERGYLARDVDEHGRERGARAIMLSDGVAARCTFCFKPATKEGWGWHLFWGRFPLWPRFFRYCDDHRPDAAELFDQR
jgi:hypothetical protein